MNNHNEFLPVTTGEKSRSYPVISEQGTPGRISLPPDDLAANPETVSILNLMISTAGGMDAMDDSAVTLLTLALREFSVTNDEVMNAFWRAYADPYVSQGKIEFRHLWKYISQSRGSGKLLTHAEAIREMEPGITLKTMFEPVEQPDGGVLWRKR